MLFYQLQLPDAGRDFLSRLFEQTMDEGIHFLNKHVSELSCPLPIISAVTTLCRTMAAFLWYLSTECGGFSPPSSNLQQEGSAGPEKASSNSIHGQTLASIFIPTQVNKSLSRIRGPKQMLSDRSISSLPFLHRHPERLCELLGKLFVFAFTWAFGGCFASAGEEDNPDIAATNEVVVRGGTTARSKFDALVHTIFTMPSGITVKLPPSADLIYSYYVDINSCSFAQWKKVVPSSREIVTKASMVQKGIQALRSTSLSFIGSSSTIGQLHRASAVGFVPTVDTVRTCFLALLIQKANHPILLSGNLGVGKTCVLAYLVKLLQSEDQKAMFLASILGSKGPYKQALVMEDATDMDSMEKDGQSIVTSLHVSSRTTSSFLQSSVERCLVRKNKSTLAAPQGKTVHLYEEVCMPVISFSDRTYVCRCLKYTVQWEIFRG